MDNQVVIKECIKRLDEWLKTAETISSIQVLAVRNTLSMLYNYNEALNG